ncbi:MAG: metal-sensing transcriptional repressor [Lachnospiraceae bacterium]|nr:metal-sensing transcriptional repressor [Lachnospiraceae bacterium]
MKDCCCHKTKEREKDERLELIHHLNRIEGQVRGVKAMVEDDRYCVDIITQVSAISASLNSFNKKLLSNHIKSCVVEDIREGDDAVVDELCQLIQKLMK